MANSVGVRFWILASLLGAATSLGGLGGLEDDSTLLQLPELQEPRAAAALEAPRGPEGLWHALSSQAHMMQSPNFLQVMSESGFKLEKMQLNLYHMHQPWKHPDAKPLSSCRTENASTVSDKHLREALMIFCESDMGSLTEYYVDPRFKDTHDRLTDDKGWIPEAFVTYVDLRADDYHNAIRLADQITLLARSVHHFSSKPIVVANTGSVVPKEWDPHRFPRMILVHARRLPKEVPFGYNKLRALLFTKVSTGVMVDADQFINNGVDDIFHRTKEECNRRYPYPILPVDAKTHEPEAGVPAGLQNNGTFVFRGDFPGQLPARSMRWGRGHPTWTHHALPFVARWSAWELQPEISASAPAWLQAQGSLQDEDLLNVALWSANATKQWCKFDTSSEEDFNLFLKQEGATKLMYDDKWYPKGVPVVFYTAYDGKNNSMGTELVEKLWTDKAEVRSPNIMYDGRWFSSGTELRKYDPSLRCII